MAEPMGAAQTQETFRAINSRPLLPKENLPHSSGSSGRKHSRDAGPEPRVLLSPAPNPAVEFRDLRRIWGCSPPHDLQEELGIPGSGMWEGQECPPRFSQLGFGDSRPYLCSVRISRTFSASQMFLAVTSPPGKATGKSSWMEQWDSASLIPSLLPSRNLPPAPAGRFPGKTGRDRGFCAVTAPGKNCGAAETLGSTRGTGKGWESAAGMGGTGGS